MAKRIVTRIGNVFCAEIDNECKRFFQYVANDLEYLNSSVIRAFKTKYPMDYEPEIEEIVKDEVEFYAHTILKFGIVFNAWYKVGTSKNIGDEYKEVLFGTTHNHIYPSVHEIIEVNPAKNWRVWRINEPPIIQNGELSVEYVGKINQGGVIPYIDIINRLKFGYFKYKTIGWKIENGKNVPIIENNHNKEYKKTSDNMEDKGTSKPEKQYSFNRESFLKKIKRALSKAFHRKSVNEKNQTMEVTLNLNARLQPTHRHKLEDIIQNLLEKEKIGTVTGGSTSLNTDGEFSCCNIDIHLNDNNPNTVKRLVEILNPVGIPKGSILQGTEPNFKTELGTLEGLGYYSNGTDLPDEVYKSYDINYVIEQMEKAMEGIGCLYSFWEGKAYTALYFYGTSYEEMKRKIEPFVASYPLCQKSRIERIA